MKKFKIIYNILFLLLAVVLLEVFSYVKLTKSFTHGSNKFYFLKLYNQNATDVRKNFTDRYEKKALLYNFRNYNLDSPDDRSIIVFGCSMAYGWKLKDDQTFDYKIAKKFNKTVYNRAFPGGGAAEMLLQLNYDDFYKHIQKAPDYVIYFYIPDHIRRLMMRADPTTKAAVVFYKLKNNKPVEKSPFILEDSYLYNLIQFYGDEIAKRNKKVKRFANKMRLPLLEAVLKDTKETLKEKYPDCKFIIVSFISNDFTNKLSKEFNVIDLQKYSGINIYNDKEYWVDNSHHPDEKYWDIVTPIITDKMKSF